MAVSNNVLFLYEAESCSYATMIVLALVWYKDIELGHAVDLC